MSLRCTPTSEVCAACGLGCGSESPRHDQNNILALRFELHISLLTEEISIGPTSLLANSSVEISTVAPVKLARGAIF